VRLRRSRLVALLAAIACVALAAAAVRVSDAGPGYDIVRGRLGVAVPVQDGELTVDRVRVGTRLSRDGSVADTTPGLFVVLRVLGSATGSTTLSFTDAQLLTSGPRVYDAYGLASTVSAAPGFGTQVDYVFEVDPARIEDLTLEIWQTEIIHGYQSRVQVHLGITAANAEEWRNAGVGQVVEVDVNGSTRALA
jgi:hypothetical protein